MILLCLRILATVAILAAQVDEIDPAGLSPATRARARLWLVQIDMVDQHC
jgi:hypothetical protein